MPRQERPRELMEPHPGDRRYVRRDDKGRFTNDQVDVGKSLATDMRRTAQYRILPGYGDRGDQRTR
jgi:hypothetical protein